MNKTNHLKTLIFFSILLLFSCSGFATLYVDLSAPGPTHDGSTWDQAFLSVQAGIDAASGEEVWVAQGIYNATIALKEEVSVYGGFAGTETLWEERNWKTNPTIIDATGLESSIVIGVNNAVLDGFTLKNAEGVLYQYGAGIYCDGASPTIANCTLTQINGHPNDYYAKGYGIYCTLSSSPTITNCFIIDNHAGYYGYGIYCESYSSPTIEDCTIARNKNMGVYGTYYCRPQISRCVITENTQEGIYLSTRSNATIKNCTITNNGLSGIQAYQESSPWIQYSLISGNGRIGIYQNRTCSSRIENCIITENQSQGIDCNFQSSPTISNCLITGNREYGIHSYYYSVPTVRNCTIVGNQKGGVYLGETSQTLRNCILWNIGNEIGGPDSNRAVVEYCCLQGGWPGTENIGVFPAFVDLNGGDYHLVDGSPCIDTGSRTYAPTTDLEGRPRPGGDVLVDMGAYESPDEYEPESVTPEPKIYRIRVDAPEGGDGLSWPTAFSTINAAMRLTGCSDEIWVASGTYLETVLMEPNVFLYGGFAGTEETKDSRDPETQVTVITPAVPGNHGILAANNAMVDGFMITGATTALHSVGMGIYSDASSMVFNDCQVIDNYSGVWDLGGSLEFNRCTISENQGYGFLASGSGVTVTLNDCAVERNFYNGIYAYSAGFILTDCSVKGNIGYTNKAAAIYCESNGSVSLTRCVVSENGTEGVHCDQSSVDMTDCEVSFNAGRGIFCEKGSAADFQGCTIEGNQTAYSHHDGGGFYLKNVLTTIEDCTITGNSCDHYGGGLYARDCNSFLVTSCTFEANTAELGGGVCFYGNITPVFEGCLFEVNSATRGGGVFGDNTSVTTLNNCTLVGNEAFEIGGGSCGSAFSGQIYRNCIFAGNTAPQGGGLSGGHHDEVEVTNCTITGNDAIQIGGGFYCDESSISITSSIIYDNAPDNITGCTDLDVRYSNIQGGMEGEGNIDLDPDFVHAWDGSWADVHLSNGSLCADVGDPAPDREDACRPPGLLTNRCDVGAYGGPYNCISPPEIPVQEITATPTPTPLETYTPTPTSTPTPTPLDVPPGTELVRELSPGEKQWFVVQASNCKAILLTLDGNWTTGQVEVYARRNQTASRFIYDLYDGEAAMNSHQEMVLPLLGGEVWHILVYAAELPEGNAEYTLQAECVDLYVSSIDPTYGTNNGSRMISIRGAGFSGDMAVWMSGVDGSSLVSDQVTVNDNTGMDAQFDLADATVGPYDLEVQRVRDGAYTLVPDAFNVTPGFIGPRLEARLRMPQTVRTGRKIAMWIEYANTGDADMTAPLFIVSSPSRTPMSMSRKGPFSPEELWVMGVSFEHPAGILRPGSSYRIPVYFLVTGECRFQLSILGGQNGEVDSGVPEWATWGDYQESLAQAATRLARRGSVVYSVEELERFARQSLAGEPVSVIQGTVRLLATGFPLEGVTVVANEPGGEGHAESVTDTAGRYMASEIPSGTYYQLSVDDYFLQEPVEVYLPSGSDLIGMDLYVLEDVPTATPMPTGSPEPIADLEPNLITDPRGDAKLVWRRGEEIWFAQFDKGEWILHGRISDTTGVSPQLVSGSDLIGETTDSSLVVWESGIGNQSNLVYAVGKPDAMGTGMIWSATETLGSATVGDFGASVVVLPDGSPFVVWLKRNQEIEDDPDLYYQSLDLSEPIEWLVLVEPVESTEEPFDTIFDVPDPSKCIQIDINKAVGVPRIIPKLGGNYSVTLLGMGCIEGDCNLKISPGIGLAAKFADDRFEFAGKVFGDYYWKTNKKKCKYVFDKGALTVSLEGTVSVPLWGVPLPKIVEKYANIEIGVIFRPKLKGQFFWTGSEYTLIPDAAAITFDIGLGPYGIVKAGIDPKKPLASVQVRGIGYINFGWDVPNGISYKDSSLELRADIKVWKVKVYYSQILPKKPGSPKLLVHDDKALYWSRDWVYQDPSLEEDLYLTQEVIITLEDNVGTGAYYGGNTLLADVSQDFADDSPASVAVAPNGEVLAVWSHDSENSSENMGMSIRASEYLGAGWSEPVELLSTDKFNDTPELAFFEDNNAMMVWRSAPANVTMASGVEEVINALDANDIYYAQRINGVWSAPAVLFESAGRESSLVLASEGLNAVAAWLHEDATATSVYASLWSMGAWSVPEKVRESTDCSSVECAFAGGIPMLVWSEEIEDASGLTRNSTLYWSTWEETWSEPVAFPQETYSKIKSKKFDHEIPEDQSKVAFKFPPWDPPTNCCDPTRTPWPTPTQYEPIPTETPRPTPKEPLRRPTEVTPLPTVEPDDVGPKDPNEKAGPVGSGSPEFYIPLTEPLEYAIYFENKSTALAATVLVEIKDQLDSHLDWSTFQLDAFSFGDTIVPVTASGVDHYYSQEMIDLWTKSGDVWAVSGQARLDILASVDLQIGLAQWTFTCLDPETEEYPEDPYAGFLPPEDGYGNGQGYVMFSILPRADASSGTQIQNSAEIVFDVNDPIVTNWVLNTIADAKPGAPANPYPPNGAAWVSRSTYLDWDDTPGASGYDLYLWKHPDLKPEDPSVENLSLSFYQPPAHLDYQSDYSWQVVAKNTGNSVEGPQWSFQVEPETTNTPTATPTGPSPTPTFTPSPTQVPTPIQGDATGDGVVDAADLFYFSKYWQALSSEADDRCNFHSDTIIDERDLLELLLGWDQYHGPGGNSK